MSTSISGGPRVQGAHQLADRLARALVVRGAERNASAVDQAVAVLAARTDTSALEARRAISEALARVSDAARTHGLSSAAGAVLGEVINDLVRNGALDDEERPAFALAEFVDRTGTPLELARTAFESALAEARVVSAGDARPEDTAAKPVTRDLEMPPCHCCHRRTWFRFDAPWSPWTCATCHPPVVAPERLLWVGRSS